MSNERIGYIDAMRGLTMILVVYSHVCNYCLGDAWMGGNRVLFLLRLPCFFFISGWLFEHPGRIWSRLTVHKVVSRKFMVQIVPTFVFLLLLVVVHDGQSLMVFFSRFGATKGGYWFTFALFEFFVLTIFCERFLRGWGGAFALFISVAAFCYDALYSRLTIHLPPSTIHLMGFLSFMTWRYFLFFWLGTWAKRHFSAFIRWTDRWWVVAAVVAGFVSVALIPHTDNLFSEYFIFAVGGILGMTMVFTLFRRLSPSTIHHPLSTIHHSPLQFIGRRTLDIYLLHYFFLPRFLLPYGERLRAIGSLPLEMLTAMAVAVAVVALTLGVSYVIRLSPFLGHYLFGASLNNNRIKESTQ